MMNFKENFIGNLAVPFGSYWIVITWAAGMRRILGLRTGLETGTKIETVTGTDRDRTYRRSDDKEVRDRD